MSRNYSVTDKILMQIDSFVRTITPVQEAPKPSPAEDKPEYFEQNAKEKADTINMLRSDHAASAAKIAFMQGQRFVINSNDELMRNVKEEEALLVWTEHRIKELGGNTSLLTPIIYMTSSAVGSGACVVSKRLADGLLSEGQAVETARLERQLSGISFSDEKTRSIIEAIVEQNNKSQIQALENGAIQFIQPIKLCIKAANKIFALATKKI